MQHKTTNQFQNSMFFFYNKQSVWDLSDVKKYVCIDVCDHYVDHSLFNIRLNSMDLSFKYCIICCIYFPNKKKNPNEIYSCEIGKKQKSCK